VREGRRKEFAGFAAFASAGQRAAIPDPNAESTYQASIPAPSPDQPAQLEWLQFYRRLLQIRREALLPSLAAARSLGAEAHGSAAVTARWRLGDGSVLWIGLNLGREDVQAPLPAGSLLFESLSACSGAAAAGLLQARSCCAFLEPAA